MQTVEKNWDHLSEWVNFPKDVLGNGAPKQKWCTIASWDCSQNYNINKPEQY